MLRVFRRLLVFAVFTPAVSGCGPVLLKGETSSNAATAASEHHRIFVTAKAYDGSEILSMEDAHVICQQAADDAGFEGTYMAILGTSKDGPSDWITISHPIYNYSSPTAKVLIASSQDEFWSGVLQNGIAYAEDFVDYKGENVWSAFNADGSGASLGDVSQTCDDWTLNTGKAAYGTVGADDANWAYSAMTFCTDRNHLYCISQ